LLINSHRITAVTATVEITASGSEDYKVKGTKERIRNLFVILNVQKISQNGDKQEWKI
jgi:hypothetical protein